MAYSALVSLPQTADLILNPHKYSISLDAKEEIISIREHAISLISLLENFPEKSNRLEGKIRDVATEAEDIIESFMWKQIDANYWGSGQSIVDFEQQLKRAKEEFGSIAGDMVDRLIDSPPAAISSSRPASTGKNDMVIGLDDELIAIKGRLCGESSKLEFIPILGMGGIGKTTLARYAYDDRLTVEHFWVRAWITISQDYTARDILSCLQDSMKLFEEQILPHEYEITMKKKVYQYLKGRRYLIVMDDVWGTKVLDDVRHIFPDDYNGSRIMLTTRLSDVAMHTVSGSSVHEIVSDSPVHEMKFMDEDQCWNLLKQKVFTKRCCPSELEDVGKEIARSCRGLPLAVVLLAGVLSKVVETRASWEEIAKNVNSFVGGQLEKILSLSYTHLPQHLRSCFLFMGGFPEDHEVRVFKLVKLWGAEGFLKRTNASKSLEEEAEEYLEDLVERSLVLVSSRKSNGKIKSCSLHDLVRELCIKKAREEKFLVHAADECVDARVDARRLSITNTDNLNDICGSATRTILCFQRLDASSSGSLDFLGRSKLLRVLDSGGQLPSEMFDLYHLRYLASRDPVYIPYFIPYLFHLHTLIINPKANKSNETVLLDIWRMPQLRHLVVPYLDVNPNPADRSTLPLENLQTLSEVKGPVCSEKFLKMFPNVKKLGLIYHQDIFPGRDYQLYNLARLGQLEKLKVTMRNFSWEGRNPAFPRSLKKLTLSGGGFPWKDMTTVGSLPNLEILKLINHACDDDDIWETVDGGFPQLKFLLIESSTLRHWITDCSHFSTLKCLILRLCLSLTEVPESIAEISSLEIIEVEYGNKFLVESAKKIQEDEQSNGNYALQVRIVLKSFYLEKTSGKKRYMIGARELWVAWIGTPKYWQWKPCADSRFSEVAELIAVCFLDIRIIIKTQMLSSNTTYAAYLVFKLAERCYGLESANAFVRFVSDEDAEESRSVVHLQQRADAGQNGRAPVWRDDGWMEVEMGSFYNDDDGGEVDARLMGIDGLRWKSGLIIEGIEFRPKTQLRHLDVSHNPADRSTLPLENLQMHSEETSGQMCYMRCARELWIVWSDNPEYWQWKPCADSRFSEVAELKRVCWLAFGVKITTQMLSSNTTYAAYLVFKLASGCYGLESANAVVRFVGDAEDRSLVVHLQQRANGPQTQNGRHPVWRNDGWMEVEMGSFFNERADDDDGVAEAWLEGIDGQNWKSGLIIEGIEFRPKTQFDP